jgi:DNA-binding CsgD family transcriptional regulator/tetratricopeptide (TPR) repeat protein
MLTSQGKSLGAKGVRPRLQSTAIRPNRTSGAFTLHGRDNEIERIINLLTDVAQAGHAGALVLTGSAGIGKTALLDSLTSHAYANGFAVARGKADEGDQIAPMAPLLLALRSGKAPVVSRRLFESLATYRDHPLWLIDRIIGILEDRASKAPVLIVLDDLQWADHLTLSCLRIMPERLAGLPIVWALAARAPNYGPIDLGRFENSELVKRMHIPLEALGDDAIEQIATDRLGTAIDTNLRQLLKTVGGNPFFAEELVARLSDRPSDVEAAALPLGLRSQVAHQVSTLSPPARRLAQLGSAFGKAFTVDDLRATSGLEEGDLLRALDETISEGILESVGPTVAFRHDLIRQAIYEDLEPTIRRDFHSVLLKYFTIHGTTNLDAVPHAMATSDGGSSSAVDVLVEASRAIASSMPSVAARLAQHAHAMVPNGDPSWFGVGEAVLQVLAQSRFGSQAVALADLLAERDHAPAVYASLQAQIAWPLWYMGEVGEIKRRTEMFLGSGELSPSLSAQMNAFHALALSSGADYQSAYDAGIATLEKSRTLRICSAQITSLRALAEASLNDGRYDDALDYLKQIYSPPEKPTTVIQEILLLQLLDRFGESAKRLQQAHVDLEGGNGPRPADVAFAQLWHDYTVGNFDDAEVDALTLINDSEEVHKNTYRVEGRLVLSRLRQLRGDFHGAARHIAIAEETESSRNEMQLLLTDVAKVFVLANQGDYKTALPYVRSVVRAQTVRHRWRWQPGWLVIAARTAVRADDIQLAKETLQIAEQLAERNPNVATIVGILEHIRGMIHRDLQALQRATQVLQDSPRRFMLGDALADYGEELLARGHRSAAVAVLEQAIERFSLLGARCDVDRVTRLLHRAGAKKGRMKTAVGKPLTGWESLTRTEQRVARLVSEGHTNRSAARELALSVNTVATHLRGIFGKLGVNSRVQLTRTLLALAPFEADT